MNSNLRRRLRFLRPAVRLLRWGKHFLWFCIVKRQLRRAKSRRIVIGCGQWKQPGWVSTDLPVLNLLKPQTWERLVRPGSVDALLAEHIWEHLTLEEARAAAFVCRRFLRSAGFQREKMRLREYHDESGQAHVEDWEPDSGMVSRSRRYDERGLISIILISIILDVYK